MGVLQDKVALVTGAGQGLGQALAFRLAKEGCHVTVADIKEEGIKQTAAQIEKDYGRKALAVICNVTDEAQVEAMVSKTVAAFGRLDIAVPNAGVLMAGDTTEFPLDKWKFVMDVNVTGYFLTAKHAARAMLPNKSGAIIHINSKSGKKGSAKNAAYATSKFAGIGLTQSLALEFAEAGIRCNAICPGNLLDGTLWKESLFKQYAKNQNMSEEDVYKKYLEQVPMKKPCTYEDVANIMVFLASDQSKYMTGQAINVTGGQEMR